ncbi:MAG TPA: MBL fold metallo-hydrolase [Gammaproteobacteria bacterium]|jgi:glyoxylase-like metal-dependent hydrolase (beta-lactamase superfamily II)
MRRRAFIESGILGASALALPRFAVAQVAADAPATEVVRGDLQLIRGAANGLLFAAGDRNVLIDVPAPDFDGATALYGTDPILINSNWRPEHTAANDVLGGSGAEIIAHENTRLWMSNDFTVRWEGRRYGPRAAEALPNSTLYTSRTLTAGDETIDIGHVARAHTDGDVYAYFQRANVLFAGDLLAVNSYPVLDYSTGGWIRGMIEATEHLLEITAADTLIVPAVGDPQRRDALEAQLELCRAADEAVGQAYTTARSLEELLEADPLEAYRAERGEPALFIELAYRGMWGHIRRLGLGIV